MIFKLVRSIVHCIIEHKYLMLLKLIMIQVIISDYLEQIKI